MVDGMPFRPRPRDVALLARCLAGYDYYGVVYLRGEPMVGFFDEEQRRQFKMDGLKYEITDRNARSHP